MMHDQHRSPQTATSPGVFSGSRRCSRCLERRPIEEFRPLRMGSNRRVAECRDCHNLAERTRVATRRNDIRARVLLAELQKIEDARSQRRLAGLTSDLVQRFGGCEKLAETIYATFESAEQSGDIRSAAKILTATTRLVRDAEQHEIFS